ncbi:NAD(P)/FAD-dependent oxidoreductase [Aneurinibacillus migulanus]|uniref:NAD(P)/FAD-dependent oxidoreductase n=1 Tax=Aneurinibacillus migulanus TaxID=47500 RepID=UPI002E1FD528|nr:NAD(P)/FAD-dependent oxidoreductase [Aneurinibacillus migulanus]
MYDCAIIGGGIAGLQAALQLGRYMHRIVVIDTEGGRSPLARRYSNILGFPDGISGPELRERGRKQAKDVGVEFNHGRVSRAWNKGEEFELELETGKRVVARRLLISTGLTDRIPDEIEGIRQALGTAVYVCPDCDGYEIRNLKAVVLGAGNAGAAMACVLRYWTDDLTYVNHEPKERPLSEHWKKKCAESNIKLVEGPILKVQTGEESMLSNIQLAGERNIEAQKGFIAFGGNKAESDIAKMLGVERLENGHIPVDGRTKETNVRHIWAAGDVAAHSQLLTVAIGDGAQAAIWIHKSLQES